MNSTQTNTPDTPADGTATAATETKKATADGNRRAYNTAQLWLALLEQTEWWVPRGAWDAYAAASLNILGVRPVFDVDGAVLVTDMDVSWRQATMNFLWRKSVGVTYAMSWGWLFTPASPYAEIDDTDFNWHQLTRDRDRRRAWFDQQPLIERMRETVIADRDARRPRPVLLEAAAPTAHPSGLILTGRR